MKTIIRVVLSFVLAATIISAAYAQPPPTPLWSDPVGTRAIALSADGQYVVVATHTEVRFYGRSSSTPLWTYSQSLAFWTSVAISADGSYVAAGYYEPQPQPPDQGRVFFWANAKSLTGNNPAWTWNSRNLYGPIEYRSLAISADGNYVAACGTGSNVFYWAGATGNSGSGIDTTWDAYLADRVEAIAISDDGNHVAAAGVNIVDGGEGVLGYWNNAISLTGYQPPTWKGQVSGEEFVDVAISNDGNYVAVAGAGAIDTVYYWAGATSRTGTPQPQTWASEAGVPFTSVDMSCDGDSVIAGAAFSVGAAEGGGTFVTAGAPDPPTRSVYFWGGARSLTGNPSPSWSYATIVTDVSI